MRTVPAPAQRYGSYSLWLDSMGDTLLPRASLDGDAQVDVAIVGGGYTGLWTAYYLLKRDPGMRVAVIEREIAGFGASGRNGGWCSALFAAPHEKIARRYGRDAAIAMQKALVDTVDEIGRVTESEGIDADYFKGGTLTLVTSPTQLERVKQMVEEDRSWGFGPPDNEWLSSEELRSRLRVAGGLGARFTPHCARVHPARLVRGLADVVERRGVTIYERTAARSLGNHRVETTGGTVTADVVVRATEGYTTELPGFKRDLMPLYSLMIATEPLPSSVWEEIGWSGYETIHDGRHLLIYAQRTADDRIAIGGRGAPYHFGSRITDATEGNREMFDAIRAAMVGLFPVTRDAAITHEWGGPLGVPRDWFSSVGYDKQTGSAWAGGYVGDGVATSNLAGRTLADLITGEDGDLVRLPWVNHRSRSWEPEPLRWLGVNLGLQAMAHADRVEEKTGRATRRGTFVKRLIGI